MDLLNRICKIAFSPAKEMLNNKVIQVEQGEYRKFSVVDSISEVYSLSGIYESINGQLLLRAVININALREYMESEKVNARDVFIRICCSYQFTELVYKLTGEKYDKFIDRGLSSRNFCLRLIGSAKKDRVKRILQFSLDNGWDKLNHVRIQLSANARFEVRPCTLSVEKINQKKIIVDQDALKNYANLVLQKYPEYLGSWDIEEKDSQWYVYFNQKTYLECPICKRTHDKDQRWFSRTRYDRIFIVKCFQQNRDEWVEIFNNPSIAKKIQQKNKNIMCLDGTYSILSPVIHNVKGPKFPWPFLEIPAWTNCDSPLTATEVYKEQYVKPLPEKGDVYVESPWETGKIYTLKHFIISEVINLLALFTRYTYSSTVTVRLNLKSYCDIETKDINLPDHQRVVCQIESLHRIINKCKCEKKCKCHPIPYDLWFDKVVSVNSQAHTRLAGRSRDRLYKLIHDARRIIVMDNDLTDLNIEWIKSFRKGKETILTEFWDWARVMSSLSYKERKSASLICHLRGDVQGITYVLIRKFPTLRIKRYHGKSDPIEKSQDFSNVEES
ncbi:hypothetical protein Glove_264g38 [Diversispora epigaea]|uniref:Replication origin-binding protein domain-containing protein n=1 Tax=Diversispora epigaea TaxID=1348612 RepID=A0A397IDP5_9GLOM|nr:hypothetical protein Glove_264g38 [Diversispora epigaea]